MTSLNIDKLVCGPFKLWDIEKDAVLFKSSDGTTHQIHKSALSEAYKIDPKLKIIGPGKKIER